LHGVHERFAAFYGNQSACTPCFFYQKMGNTNLSDREVMNFKKIGNPNRILIDVDNAYYNRLKLSGYPYFILYDTNGNALDWFSGYLSHFQEDYEDHLTQLFSTN